MKQGWKYLLILILFLIPGIGLFSNEAMTGSLPDDEQDPGVSISHHSMTTSQDIYTVMMDTFSAICRVESLKVEGTTSGRDFFRSAFVVSKNFRIPVKQFSYHEDYHYVLAERYVQGAYIYFHKLII